MQLTPVVQRKFGVQDPYDPAQSAYAAARYLRWGRHHFGSWHLALGAYGCGPARARRCEAYVAKVVDAMGYAP
jgi:soluble lytic murein transglycosylase-like protein